ncbi:hypothetical protein COPCOM_03760 [Coprococcus comes ATCC 27758]|uniref:Uncharacterized protein n=1 Tax=Coprococcus comes ATCC 27758 TaxID=470146 RepID=C0BEZ8_9FIRM|nr:hypothetical protein COPCOM_03760 [Coprococcus comes ATCC 27758]
MWYPPILLFLRKAQTLLLSRLLHIFFLLGFLPRYQPTLLHHLSSVLGIHLSHFGQILDKS